MIFIPKPNSNEKESDYIGRCIPIVSKEHPDWDNKQCTAVCYSMWKQHNKEKNKQILSTAQPPHTGEEKDAFIKRCKVYYIEHGTLTEPVADGVCSAIWENYNQDDVPRGREGGGESSGGQSTSGGVGGRLNKVRESTNLNMKERVHLNLCANLEFGLLKDGQDGVILATSIERSSILVGNGVYNGIYFPMNEVEKSLLHWNKKPWLLDHSDKIEDTFGHIEEPFYDKNSGRLTVRPVIDNDTVKAKTAEGYIMSRLRSGMIPEVSVGVWVDKTPVENEERKDGALFVASNLEPDHLALVTRGACSPKDGCGIGLKIEDEIIRLKKSVLMERIKEEKLHV